VFKMIMLITEWGAFLLGLVSVLLYYGVFHPSLHARVCTNTIRTDTADAQQNTLSLNIMQLKSRV